MSVTQASLLGDTFGSKASGTIPVGGIIMWSGSIATIPTGWSLCNGQNGTPNLRDKFIVGATSDGDSTYPGIGVGNTGGSADSVVVNHTHRPEAFLDEQRYNFALTSAGLPVTSSTGYRAIEATAGGNGTWISTAGDVWGATGNVKIGSTATNTNLPPYYALAFIMRVS